MEMTFDNLANSMQSKPSYAVYIHLDSNYACSALVGSGETSAYRREVTVVFGVFKAVTIYLATIDQLVPSYLSYSNSLSPLESV